MPWSRVYYTTFLSESEVVARISAVYRIAEIHEKKKRTPTDVSVVVLTRTYFVSDFTSSYIGRTGLSCGLVLKNNFKVKQLTVVTQYPTIRVTHLHPIIFDVFKHICGVNFVDKSLDYDMFILDNIPIVSGYLIWYQEGELAWVNATGSLLIFFVKG